MNIQYTHKKALATAAVNGLCIAAMTLNPVILVKSICIGALCSLSQDYLLKSEWLSKNLKGFFSIPEKNLPIALKIAAFCITGYIFMNIAALSTGIGVGLPIASGLNVGISLPLGHLFSGSIMTLPALITPFAYEKAFENTDRYRSRRLHS